MGGMIRKSETEKSCCKGGGGSVYYRELGEFEEKTVGGERRATTKLELSLAKAPQVFCICTNRGKACLA